MVSLIRVHLAGEFRVQPSSITELTDIRGEIPVESVDVFTLEKAIKQAFGVEVSFFVDHVETVGDIADLVKQRLNAASG